MSTAEAPEQGFISVPGGRCWFRRSGRARPGGPPPVVVVHGGPGSPHDYLENLESLASDREVVFYDQLGCGRSDRPADARLWNLNRFVAELGAVVRALHLERPHLIGHSWGTIPTAEYALAHQGALSSLTLYSPCLDMKRVIADMTHLRAQLPPALQALLSRHEDQGTTDSAPYRLAAREFYRRHVCRLPRWPPCLSAGFESWALDAYRTMWGPSEFFITGNLREHDLSGRLGQLRLPVLFLCGRHDEMTPETTAGYQALVADSQLVIFEESAHLAHLEQPEEFRRVLSSFLRSPAKDRRHE